MATTPTLYDIYNGQGKQLPTTVDARFADPAFAQAASKAGVTKDAYVVNGGNAAMNNRIASAYNAAPATPTPAQAPAIPGEQTSAQRAAAYNAAGVQQPAVGTAPKNIGDIYGAGLSDTDKLFNDFVDQARTKATQTVDEQAIRDNIQKQLQAETDAINKIYDERLRVARIGGENNLGTTAAINARRGLLGSDFGNTQRADTENRNAQVYAGIDAERGAAISALTNKGAAMIRDEIAQKNSLRSQSTTDYINYLAKQEERRSSRVKDAVARALSAGIDLATASQSELKAVADSYQISPDALMREYGVEKTAKDKATAEAEAKKAEEARKAQDAVTKALKEQYITLSDGVTLYDTKTGKIVAENAKNFAPKAPPRPVTPKGDPITVQRTKDTAARIINGQGSLDGLTPTMKTDVKNQLYKEGYGTGTKAPTWYTAEATKLGLDPATAQSQWDTENARIFKETAPKKKGASSSSPTVDDL